MYHIMNRINEEEIKNMKKLNKAELNVVKFETEDVIVASGCKGDCLDVCSTDCIQVCYTNCKNITYVCPQN